MVFNRVTHGQQGHSGSTGGLKVVINMVINGHQQCHHGHQWSSTVSSSMVYVCYRCVACYYQCVSFYTCYITTQEIMILTTRSHVITSSSMPVNLSYVFIHTYELHDTSVRWPSDSDHSYRSNTCTDLDTLIINIQYLIIQLLHRW